MATVKQRDTRNNPTCSFCERSEQDLEREDELNIMIKGGTGYICAPCIDLCTQLIADHRKAQTKGS